MAAELALRGELARAVRRRAWAEGRTAETLLEEAVRGYLATTPHPSLRLPADFDRALVEAWHRIDLRQGRLWRVALWDLCAALQDLLGRGAFRQAVRAFAVRHGWVLVPHDYPTRRQPGWPTSRARRRQK